jgi:hypothetical protein
MYDNEEYTSLIDNELFKATKYSQVQGNNNPKCKLIKIWGKNYNINIDLPKKTIITFKETYNTRLFFNDSIKFIDSDTDSDSDTDYKSRYKKYIYDYVQPIHIYIESDFKLGYTIHPVISKITTVIDKKLNMMHFLNYSKLKKRDEIAYLHLSYNFNIEVIYKPDDIIFIIENTKYYFYNFESFINDIYLIIKLCYNNIYKILYNEIS